jgi:hypothetical protein
MPLLLSMEQLGPGQSLAVGVVFFATLLFALPDRQSSQATHLLATFASFSSQCNVSTCPTALQDV